MTREDPRSTIAERFDERPVQLRICGGPFVPIELVDRDPPTFGAGDRLRLDRARDLGEHRVKANPSLAAEVLVGIAVLVLDLPKRLRLGQANACLLGHFPSGGVVGGLPLLHLSAGELPEPAPNRPRMSSRSQHFDHRLTIAKRSAPDCCDRNMKGRHRG